LIKEKLADTFALHLKQKALCVFVYTAKIKLESSKMLDKNVKKD